jgi:hypothetical protein
MGGECSTFIEKKISFTVWCGNLKKREQHWVDLGVDWMILLKIVVKMVMTVQSHKYGEFLG